MNYFYLDHSAIVKRYHTESGSDVVNYLLDTLMGKSEQRLCISILGIGETIAVLNRKKVSTHLL